MWQVSAYLLADEFLPPRKNSSYLEERRPDEAVNCLTRSSRIP